MANFTYLKQSANLIGSATLTPDTEDSDFPIENVQSEPVAEVYRSTSASAQKILIDFSGAVDANMFAVLNHNLQSSATIVLRAGTTQDPDGTAFTANIHNPTTFNRNAWRFFANTQQFRYWSVTINDPTNPDGVIESGLFVIGVRTELTRNFNRVWEKRRETLNQALESEYGVLTTGISLFQRTRFVASWKTSNASERSELDDFLVALEKERGGMFFVPDDSETEAFYGRLRTNHALIRTSADIAEVNGLEFLEDSVGKSVF